jgi:hypothetical protein
MRHEFATICKAVLWFRRLVAVLSLQRPGFDPRPVRVGFVVDIVALGQFFLRVFHFSFVPIIPPMLRAYSSITDAV